MHCYSKEEWLLLVRMLHTSKCRGHYSTYIESHAEDSWKIHEYLKSNPFEVKTETYFIWLSLLFQEELEKAPLLINCGNGTVETTAKWRLMIGR